MVLKVVRGKILETLELSLRPSSPFGTVPGISAGAFCRLSKNLSYLIDNLHSPMLSVSKGVVKKKCARPEASLPDANLGHQAYKKFQRRESQSWGLTTADSNQSLSCCTLQPHASTRCAAKTQYFIRSGSNGP